MKDLVSNLYSFFKDVYLKYSRDRGSFLAAIISYYSLFSIFPFILVLISLAGFFLAQREITDDLLRYTQKIVPQFSGLIKENIKAVASSRGQVGVIGVIGLLWGGTAVFDALEYALDEVWGEAEDKPIFRAKLLGIATVIGLGVVLVIITLALPLISAAREYGLRTPVGKALLSSYNSYIWLVGLLVTIIIFLVIYHVVPSRRPKIKDVLPGALAAGLTWEVAKRLFSWYLNRAARFSAVYGSLGIVIGLLFWLYLLGVIIVVGGEFAVVLQARRKGLNAAKK